MKGKLIIIEGPDECGKTTLSLALARALNGVALHSTASPALFNALPDYHRNILDNCEQNVELGRVVILDRFWPSEMAYGLRLLRPDSGYGQIADELDKRIIKMDYLYIFCFSRGSWLRYKQGHNDPAHSLTQKQYEQIWKNYEQIHGMLKNFSYKTLVYQIEQDGTDEEFPRFINVIRTILEIPVPVYA